MKRSIFGVYQFDEVVGAVVLACVGVFAAVLINAGLMKDWFQPSFTLRILLPDEGVSGLAPGAEVQVAGTRAGEVRRIVIDPNQRMHAVARVDEAEPGAHGAADGSGSGSGSRSGLTIPG